MDDAILKMVDPIEEKEVSFYAKDISLLRDFANSPYCRDDVRRFLLDIIGGINKDEKSNKIECIYLPNKGAKVLSTFSPSGQNNTNIATHYDELDETYRIRYKLKLDQDKLWGELEKYPPPIQHTKMIFICDRTRLGCSRNTHQLDLKQKELATIYPFIHYYCAGGYMDELNVTHSSPTSQFEKRVSRIPLVLYKKNLCDLIEELPPFTRHHITDDGNIFTSSEMGRYLNAFLSNKLDVMAKLYQHGLSIWGSKSKEKEVDDATIMAVSSSVYDYFYDVCEKYNLPVDVREHPREYYLCKDSNVKLFECDLSEIIKDTLKMEEAELSEYAKENMYFFGCFMRDEKRTIKWISHQLEEKHGEQSMAYAEQVYKYFKDRYLKKDFFDSYPMAYLYSLSADDYTDSNKIKDAAINPIKLYNDYILSDIIHMLPPLATEEKAREEANKPHMIKFFSMFLADRNEALRELEKWIADPRKREVIFDHIDNESSQFWLGLKEQALDEVNASYNEEYINAIGILTMLDLNMSDSEYVKERINEINDAFDTFVNNTSLPNAQGYALEVRAKFNKRYIVFAEGDHNDTSMFEVIIDVCSTGEEERAEVVSSGIKKEDGAVLLKATVKIWKHINIDISMLDDEGARASLDHIDTYKRVAEHLNSLTSKGLDTLSSTQKGTFILDNTDIFTLYSVEVANKIESLENKNELKEVVESLKQALQRYGLKRLVYPTKITEQHLREGYEIVSDGSVRTSNIKKHHTVVKEVRPGFTIQGTKPNGEKDEVVILRTGQYNVYIN